MCEAPFTRTVTSLYSDAAGNRFADSDVGEALLEGSVVDGSFDFFGTSAWDVVELGPCINLAVGCEPPPLFLP